ncbi:MAG: GNAT family protein [Anaerolineales bacterium]|nr:MAG: GNAT family protein [Anaerolineales bacterium]
MMTPLQFFPKLETERLLLRPLTMNDLDFVFRHFSEPLVTEFLLDEAPISDIAQAREMIESYQESETKSWNRWGIVLKNNHQIIGTCGYHKWNKRDLRAEIGYDLGPEFWGKGIMTEALRAALQNGLEGMGLNRIEAMVHPQNQGSLHLLHKLGFQKEGLLRDYHHSNGSFHSHYILSLLKRDWK